MHIAALMQLTLCAVRTVQSSGLGTARPLTICTRGVLDAPRLSPSCMLGAVTVLHSWRALRPVGARRLEAVRHHAGPASEPSAGCVKPAAATRAMHPPATAKPMHVALCDRPAIARKEHDSRSHRYDRSAHVSCLLRRSCLCTRNSLAN